MKFIVVMALFCIASLPSFAQEATPEVTAEPDNDTLSEGLILHLPIEDGNAEDITDNDYDIRVNGGEFLVDRFDVDGSAFVLDGNDDYIRIGDTDTLDLEDTLSISIWLFYVEQATSTWYTILEKTGPADGHARYGFWVMRDLAEMCIEPASNAPRVGPQMCFDSELMLNDGEWNHIAGTYDGQTIAIFINGEPAGTLDRAQPDGISTTDAPLYIGTDLNASRPNYLLGAVDDIRIYDRVLTDDEIVMLYEFDPTDD